MSSGDRAFNALNRLAKWRAHFAGWQLGTRLKGDPESDAVRDHRELSLLLRVEVTALVRLLLERGIFTPEQLEEVLAEEADNLSASYEQRWPGVSATDDGLTYDGRAIEWMKRWRP